MASLLVGVGMGKWEFPYVFPIFPLSIAPPWVIGKVLTWCVVIIIKTITFTHVIREIPIIVMRIDITCKCMFAFHTADSDVECCGHATSQVYIYIRSYYLTH